MATYGPPAPTQYISGPQFAKNGFSFRQKWNADGTPGIDYFDAQGNPITNQQFAAATGADTNLIEHGSTEGVPLVGGSTLHDFAPTPKSTGTAQPSGFPLSWNGKVYNSAGELQADQNSFYDEQLHKALTGIDTQETTGLDSLNSSLFKALGFNPGNLTRDINAAGGQIGDQRNDVNTQATTAHDTLRKGHDTAVNNIGAFYSGLGPIYQSSQGVLNGQADDEYHTADAGVDTQKAKSMSALETALNDFIDSYLGGVQSTKSSAGQARTAATQQRTTSADSLTNAAFDLGIKPVSYNAPTNTPIAPQAVNTYSSLLDSIAKMIGTGSQRKTYNGVNPDQGILSFLSQGF
jgi:hypothetical protein